MDEKILCKTCIFWVDCNNASSFCLMRDLYTPTAETKCDDYEEGKPMTEQEYEDFNARIY